jgi:hypothetical protein
MNDYLWDRSGPVDPAVADLEARLQSAAFDPTVHPLNVPPARQAAPGSGRGTVRTALYAAAACMAAIAALAAFHQWRLRWDTGRPWTINGGASSLNVGGSLHVRTEPATVDIARLGQFTARPGTELTLTSTGPSRHRMTLNRGEIDVRVWAPPGRVAVHTSAGDVIDLGCMFRLSVDDGRAAHVTVDTGWVNLDNVFGNSFVPAGASASMAVGRRPDIPVYDDASVAFRQAVRSLELAPAALAPDLVRTIVEDARTRDAVTLLTLSDIPGLGAATRTAVLERLAVLEPPANRATAALTMAGDRDAFWRWHDDLPLPALKNWWANWRDVFPR